MAAEAVAVAEGWGTWEELILGGAVLRHGTRDWNVVASELRARTLYPYAFTPKACRERYKDLLKRYSGSTTWFEELRKRRVAELKQELARSENSIGSLESKVKHLEVERQHSNQIDYGSSETVSPVPALDSEATESVSRQTSNDENSVSNFTKETNTITSWLGDQQHQPVETDMKPSTSACSEQDKGSRIKKFPEIGYECGLIVRKKRGQRKRRNCNQAIKEKGFGESDNLASSSNVVSIAPKETSTNDNELIRISDMNNHCGDRYTMRRDSLIEIFKSVVESEPAAVFKHRMDSQKRARYRRVIKQHMDISTIRSRIVGQSIKAAKELFRDMLLVANNALVFYSRRTREYKAAIALRHLVMREYRLHCRGYCHEATSAFIPCNPPVKPRTARPRPQPCKDKALERCSNAENVVLMGEEKQRGFDNNNNVSKDSMLLMGKIGLKRAGKVKPGLADPPRKTTPLKQRKRVRR